MGEKEKARATMKREGVPILPGLGRDYRFSDEALEWARSVGFPVIVKASAGGGGRGMRIIRDEQELPNLFTPRSPKRRRPSATAISTWRSSSSGRATSSSRCWPIEHGNVMSLGERECSIQRRHQKLLEESPSTQVTPELRDDASAASW
jgi:acetyl-CoA carboxylase, biotin carboxylase subunit